jgi:poly-gamma-glutamate capsule biosynthesis protein CapA/YwtB (metallophosphatase superfamily)
MPRSLSARFLSNFDSMNFRNTSLLLALLAISLFVLNFSSCTGGKNIQKPDEVVSPATSNENVKANAQFPDSPYLSLVNDSVVDITINLVGDLMCHMPQANNCKSSAGYDFNPSYEYIRKYLEDADLTMGNLELTCAGTCKPYSGYPNFNAPDEYVTALKQSGFDFVVTSNNHSMDTGEDGLLRTIEIVKQNGLGYSGTFSTQKDHDSIRVLNIKGLKIAVLNYTYGTNGAYPSSDHKYMLNVIDSTAITNEVKKAKTLQPDFVLVFYHYGTEYMAEPIESQKKAVKWARDAGATLIIGGHPHVVGPCHWLVPDVNHADTAFVAWSLGNFFSNQNKRYTDAGVVLTLHLRKNFSRNSASISSAEFLPTWVYRGEKSEKKLHVIFPAAAALKREELPAYLDSSLVNKMKQAYEDTREIINKYGPTATVKPLRQ